MLRALRGQRAATSPKCSFHFCGPKCPFIFAAQNAHFTAFDHQAVCFMMPLGASVAGANHVGNALGRGDAACARRSASVCVSLGCGFGVCAALLLLLLQHLVRTRPRI